MSSNPNHWVAGQLTGIERIDGEPVIGSGFEESLLAAGFARGPRRLVASA